MSQMSDPHQLDASDRLAVEVPADARALTGDPDPAPAPDAAAGPNASESPAAPAAAAFLPVRRRVDGRYRAAGGSFSLELRVDVDGPGSLARVSGDYTVVTGASTNFFGSWVIDAPTVSGAVDELVVAGTPRDLVVEGTARCSWSTTFTHARISIPWTFLFQPAGQATLTWSNAAGTAGTTYVGTLESRAFRTVLWEQDSVVGTLPFVSYDTGSLPQPAGSAARVLSVPAAYAEAGVEMLAAGTPNVIPNTLSGPDTRWSEAELHAAMQADFSLWSDVPQWRVYTLVATRYAGQDGVRGIMYDYGDAHQRQGMAVFHDSIAGADAATQRAQLRTYVHELGHAFNLLHSWDKAGATPPQPLGPNGGLGDLSWMNYAWKYQPPLPAPGGETAYWSAFPFHFTPNELIHLRHGMRPDVIMGGNAFATGAGDVDPRFFATPADDRSGLALQLRFARSYALGEPVVAELRLGSTGRAPLHTHGRLHPRDGLVTIAVQDPSGRAVAYRPLMPRCVDGSATTVLDDARPALYDSAYIGFGRDGFVFDQVGTYRLRAVYTADDGSRVVSPTASLRVRAPLTAADDHAAELLMGDDAQGHVLYLLGSDAPALAGANAAMDELADRYPEHPLTVFARLTRGVNAERSFKSVTAAKNLDLRPADTRDAVTQLTSVVAASGGDGGVDNITLNMVVQRLAEAQAKAGDLEKARATLGRMPQIFRKKGLKAHVLQVIADQAVAAQKDLPPEH